MTQQDIDAFAALTGDRQWIHVDCERAAKESPFGTTIAHGDLVLALVGALRADLLEASGFEFGLNRGWRKVVFLAPVRSGDQIRATVIPRQLSSLGGDWWEFLQEVDVTSERERIFSAEAVSWLLAS